MIADKHDFQDIGPKLNWRIVQYWLQVRSEQCHLQARSSYFCIKETVTGSISISNSFDSDFRINVESISLSIWGGVSPQTRQNKPDTEEIVRKVPPLVIINIPSIVIAKAKIMYFISNIGQRTQRFHSNSNSRKESTIIYKLTSECMWASAIASTFRSKWPTPGR